METKQCKACQISKPIIEFYKDKKTKDGFWGTCKDCVKERTNSNYNEKKEFLKERAKNSVTIGTKKCYTCNKTKPLKEYYKDIQTFDGHRNYCKSCHKIKDIGYYQKNKGVIKGRVKSYNQKHKKEVSKYQKNYSKSNRKLLSSYQKKYRQENRAKINKQKLEKRKYEPVLILSRNISTLIYQALKRKGFKKGTVSRLILKCSYEEFLIHLNNNSYGFKYGDKGLDLDHIIACNTANTEEEITKLNHYKNFQLLPRLYNQGIKKDNPWNREHFEEWLKNKH